jgi:hypothetical protein
MIVDDYKGRPVAFLLIYTFDETDGWLAFCRTKCNFSIVNHRGTLSVSQLSHYFLGFRTHSNRNIKSSCQHYLRDDGNEFEGAESEEKNTLCRGVEPRFRA